MVALVLIYNLFSGPFPVRIGRALKKIGFLGDMSPIRGGGVVDPPPTKTVDFS